MVGGRGSLVTSLAGCLFLCLLAGSVYGDGAGRKATVEEQEFYRSTQDILAAALPVDVPEGWELTGQADSNDLEVVGIDTGARPMEVDYYLEWTNVIRQQQAEEKAYDQISAVAGTAVVSDAQVAEYEQLAIKVAEAAAAGDQEAVRALQQQMEARARVINQAFDEMDEKIIEINRATAAPDSHVVIRLLGNRLHQSLEQGAERIIVAGYPAFRTEGHYSSSGEWHEGITTVFMGQGWFADAGDSAYQFAAAEKAEHTRLQTVVVVIEADPARVASVVEMIDWQALQAVLENE